MDRRILFPLISMFLAFLLCSDIISAQNWIFKGVAVSDEGIYAMTENNTLVKLTESLNLYGWLRFKRMPISNA